MTVQLVVVFLFCKLNVNCLVPVANENQKFKIPILTTDETYFTSVKEDTSHLYDAVTYKPTALEVLFEYSVPHKFFHTSLCATIASFSDDFKFILKTNIP